MTVLMAVLSGCSSASDTQTPEASAKQATSMTTTNVPATTPASAGNMNTTDCITRDGSGQQIWFQEASPRTIALGNALQAIVDEHMDRTAGVALCSHDEGATIFVVSPTEDVHKSIGEVASKFPDLEVITRTVTASISQLVAVGTKLLKSPNMKVLIAGVGPDMYSGGLLITVAQDKWPLTENEKHRIDNAVEAINGSRLPLTYEQGGTPVLD
jgi:ABC-type Fe3+-hydroxamate transport system substrate-binding protein